MFGFVEKVEEKSLGFMKSHPKFTKYAIAGSTALAAVGGSSVVAFADGDESAASGDAVDTVIDTMSSSLQGLAPKVIAAGLGVGLIFFGARVAWKWIKSMAK